MSLASKFDLTDKKRIATFCCATVALVVALIMLPSEAWTWRSSDRRPPLSWIPMPDAAILVFSWLGGWFIALFATEESDYRWHGVTVIAVSLILGALMLAPVFT